MFKNKFARTVLFATILIALVAYFSGLPIDVTRDAGKYATISKEIFQNGNYINLTVHKEAYLEKPPMLFWMGAMGFAVGEISNFWFKLPVLLLVFAGFYWAFRLGESLYNRRVGYLTAVMLGFSFIYSLYSMDIHTDTPLQAFVILAFWQLWEFIKTRKHKNWILGFVAIGLAMLTKGPIGGAIPAFAVVGHIVLKKDFKFLFDYRWFLGIVLALVVASPAMIGLMNQFGIEGLKFFFWENMAGRITGSYVQATNDPVFYVHTLLYMFLPWSLLFFVAVFYEFRTLVRNRFRSPEYFTFAGIWVYFVIINSASSQLPNYVFAIVPLMAVLSAKWIDKALKEDQKLYHILYRVQNGIVVLLWGAVLGILLYLFPGAKWHLWVLLLAGAGITAMVYLKPVGQFARILLPSLIVFACFAFMLNTHVFPYMFGLQAPPKAGRYFTENAGKNDTLYNYKYAQYELFFYSEPQAAQLYSDDEMKAVAGKAGTWIFTDPEGLKEIEKLRLEPDTLIEYRHLYLNRPGKFINPKNRDKVLQPMYLIKY